MEIYNVGQERARSEDVIYFAFLSCFPQVLQITLAMGRMAETRFTEGDCQWGPQLKSSHFWQFSFQIKKMKPRKGKR